MTSARSTLRTLVGSRDAELVRWRLLGVLFLLGGVLAEVSVALEPQPHGAVTQALGVAAFAVGALLLVVRPPHPHAFDVGLFLGTAMISSAAAVGEPTFALYPLMLVWVGVEGALFLDPGRAWRLLIAALGCYGAALTQTDDARHAVMTWFVTAGSMSALGGMSWLLRLRTDVLVEELVDAASADVLTGTLNRRGYREAAGRAIADGVRAGQPFTVVLGELDSFKELNDRHGHDVGDEVLQTFAEICLEHVRDGDRVARVGGDELAVLLPNADAHRGLLVAERLRRALGSRLAATGRPGTASFGVATSPEHGLSADVLLDSAGQAVGAAKAMGRDRTVVFSDQLAAELPVSRREATDRREHLQAVLVLAETLDLRDSSTARHSHRVGELSALTAETLGLGAERVARIRLAGLLHDVGKVGVPDGILQKPGKLTPEEYEQIKQHSELGARILEGANLHDLAAWVVAHHERPDGLGYPDGLTGEAIPLEARILGVADAYEAMTADRVYRSAMSPQDAAAELRRHAGAQFDAAVVEALLGALEDRALELGAPVLG